MMNRGRIALLMAASFSISAVSIAANQTSAKLVTLTDDNEVAQYQANAKNVEELLEQLEIELDPRDVVAPILESEITEDMNITIERWNPMVTVTVDGISSQFETKAFTVSDLLKELGVETKADDVIEPALDTLISNGLKIDVKKRKIETVVENRPMSYEKEVVPTNDMPYGETKVKQAGKNGLKEVTTEKEYLGGELIRDEVTNVTVLEEPVKEIILKGTYRENAVVDKFTGESYTYTNVYNMEATAYTNSTNGGWGNKTASGMTTFVGMVAVDPRVIPLGTKLYIEDYGIAIAGDTGGAIKGHIVDLFMNSRSECRRFGRQQGVKVYVLEDQSVNVKAERASY